MALVHFVDKPKGKKVARLSKYMRAVYDGEKVILRYDTTKIVNGQLRKSKQRMSINTDLKSFMDQARKHCRVNFTGHTLDQPSTMFEFFAQKEGGFYGEYGDVNITISKEGLVKICDFSASNSVYRGDIEGSIRDLLGSQIWQHTGQSWQNSTNYKHNKKEVIDLFNLGHVRWNGLQVTRTSTT